MSVMSYSDEDARDIENYQDARQSLRVAMEEGQRTDHLPKADGGQRSGAARDQMHLEGRPLGPSSNRIRHR